MFIRSLLLKMAPESGKLFDLFGQNFLTLQYYHLREDVKDKLILWHKESL
jgi:hypothetical protein